MSNVFQLFGQKKIEDPSDPATNVTIAVADILASHVQLTRTANELSKHLDAVDNAIDAVSDTRNRLKQVAKLARGRLMNAILELTSGVRKLAGFAAHGAAKLYYLTSLRR